MRKIAALVVPALFAFSLSAIGQELNSPFAKVTAGSYTPLYRDSLEAIQVERFEMQTMQVTNGQFLDFVTANPTWRKSQVKRLYAEESYLGHWVGDTELGPAAPANSPVVNVSWFAARAYCVWAGRSLPTVDQWEYAAAASTTKSNDYESEAYRAELLQLYGQKQTTPLPKVGSGVPNFWGLYNMHGMVWEWVDDFNSILISGESRKDGSVDRDLFCAAGALGSLDPANYAAYLRYSFRGSLKASYCLKGLGFRVVKN